MKLLRDKSSNRFCGPAALALLAGVHVDEATRVLREVSGKRAIKGVVNHHMLLALERLGRKAVFLAPGAAEKRYGQPPTLTQSLASLLRDRNPEQPYLLVVTGHYVVIRGRKLYDNKHPEGVWLGECPYRRKRVRAVWRVIEAPPAPPAPAPISKEFSAPPRMTFPKFVDALGQLRLDTDSAYVDAPFGFSFADGLHSFAITGTYEEALERAKGELPLIPCPAECHCRE